MNRPVFPLRLQCVANSNTASLLLALVLIALIAHQLITGIFPVWQAPSRPTHPATPQLPAFRVPAAAYDATALRQLKLFQPVQKADNDAPTLWQVGSLAPDDPRLMQAPPTKLPLRLTGVLSNGHCAASLAIIEHNRHQESYSCGDILPVSGAELVAIFPDRILVSYQGNYQTLILN